MYFLVDLDEKLLWSQKILNIRIKLICYPHPNTLNTGISETYSEILQDLLRSTEIDFESTGMSSDSTRTGTKGNDSTSTYTYDIGMISFTDGFCVFL